MRHRDQNEIEAMENGWTKRAWRIHRLMMAKWIYTGKPVKTTKRQRQIMEEEVLIMGFWPGCLNVKVNK